MARPKTKELKAVNPNAFTNTVQTQLKKRDKSWDWISEQTGIRREVIRSWLNGAKKPHIDNIIQIAFILGVEPKIMLAGMEVGLSKSKNVRCIIAEKAVEKKLEWQDFTNSPQKINRKTAARAMDDDFLPSYATLEKFALFFRCRPIDLYQITSTPNQFKK